MTDLQPAGWTTPADLVADLQRLWDRGALLAEVAGAPSIFPHRFRVRRPATAELLDRFEDVRAWSRELARVSGLRIELVTRGARSIGRNDLPGRLWVDDLNTACDMLGAGAVGSLDTFRSLVAETLLRIPQLVAWMAAHPLQVLEVADAWTRLLDVVLWMQRHPRPGIYVRQVDIVGVHTKFVETHRVVLGALLDHVLDPSQIDTTFGAASGFEPRYGFLSAPATVRLRALDDALAVVAGAADRPVSVTVEDFARLRGVERVFVTENYVNFLAFPRAERSIVVFGEGFDVGKIATARWIAGVAVYYWGDIDTHGFAILDLLRARLPNVVSLLMNHATLLAHEAQWGEEPVQFRKDLPHLTRAERELYDDLRDNRIRRNLRLEQELTAYHHIVDTVAALARTSSPCPTSTA